MADRLLLRKHSDPSGAEKKDVRTTFNAHCVFVYLSWKRTNVHTGERNGNSYLEKEEKTKFFDVCWAFHGLHYLQYLCLIRRQTV